MFFRQKKQVRPQAAPSEDAQIAARRFQEAWEAMRKRVSLLEGQVAELQEQLSTTVSQLGKLRGQVHGPRAQQARASPNSLAEIPFGDKGALRERAGLVHGQRFIHPEEEKEK